MGHHFERDAPLVRLQRKQYFLLYFPAQSTPPWKTPDLLSGCLLKVKVKAYGLTLAAASLARNSG